MSDVAVISAQLRERAGKGAARAIRREGLVPGVIYGKKQEPILLKMDPRPLVKLLDKPGFYAHVIAVEVAGESYSVLPKDVQLDPVSDAPLHVDFLRFSEEDKLTVTVPVRFINEEASPGLKRGGVLNVVRHEIEIVCPSTAIPETITVDLTGTDLNDSIHISAVKLPEGARPTITDRDFTVATIAAPSGLKVETEETEETTEE